MRRSALILVTVALAAGVLVSAAPPEGGQSTKRAVTPYAATFPEGAGAAIAQRACTVCHSPMLVTQQAKDAAAWERSLAQMEKWGSPTLSPAERDTLLRWLIERWGPRAK